MTTETERRVPEHPGWQPWWIRYAEYEGQKVVLTARTLLPPQHVAHLLGGGYAYSVYDPDTVVRCRLCGWEYGGLTRRSIAYSDSLAEAKAAFEAACERLREGG